MANRALLRGLLLLFGGGLLWATSVQVASATSVHVHLASASGQVDVTCGVFGGTVSNGGSTLPGQNILSTDCDNDQTIPDDICADIDGCEALAVGSGNAYLYTVPEADVQGGISGDELADTLQSPAWFSGEAQVDYSGTIDQTGTPPEEESGIPVTMTVGGSTIGIGSQAYAVISGPSVSGLYKAGSKPEFDLTPGNVYSVSVIAACSAAGDPGAYCQAVADPLFQFDQAAFDAELAKQGLPSFSLSEYYSFAYSPNLIPAPAPTPEPSSLSLLLAGFFIMGTMALRGRE